MDDKLNMSLDQIIESNKSKLGKSRDGGKRPQKKLGKKGQTGIGGSAGGGAKQVARQEPRQKQFKQGIRVGGGNAGISKRTGVSPAKAQQRSPHSQRAPVRVLTVPRPTNYPGGAQKTTPKPSQAFASNGTSDGASKQKWQRDLYPQHDTRPVRRETTAAAGTKLKVSNLEYVVTDNDIKELFSNCGALKSFGVHYDNSGRSLGTAEVIYHRHEDALKAIETYNNVALDGKKMFIELAAEDPGFVTRLSSGISVVRTDSARGGSASGLQVTRTFQRATQGMGTTVFRTAGGGAKAGAGGRQGASGGKLRSRVVRSGDQEMTEA